MTIVENIKSICRERRNISITTLEQELGYSNGSLAKAKDIPSSRIYEIANYLEVSMEYIMTGEKPEIPVIDWTPEHLEIMELYNKFNKEQKSAILNLMRTFALSN